jgi:hypothetical protein
MFPIVIGWLTPYLGDTLPRLRRHTVSARHYRRRHPAVEPVCSLGANFWDELRALFIREARVVFPEQAVAA